MPETYNRSALLRVLSAVCLGLLFGLLLLPTLSGVVDCDCEKGCDDHDGPICACTNCIPVSPACEVAIPGLAFTFNVSSFVLTEQDDGQAACTYTGAPIQPETLWMPFFITYVVNAVAN